MTIKEIAEAIKNLFKSIRTPAQTLPAPLAAIAAPMKPGLSMITSVGNIAKVLNEHDIPTSPLPDGTENKNMVLVTAIVDEIYRAIRQDARFQTSFAPGAITTVSMGANGGGPVVTQGININFPMGETQGL